VYRGTLTPEEYLRDESGSVANAQLVLEELLLLWIGNRNPAVRRYKELFDDAPLIESSAYDEVLSESYLFFDTQPSVGEEQLNLIDFLRSPAHAVPDSLSGQLRYIRDSWGEDLGAYADLLLRSIDYLNEEWRPRAPGGPAPSHELTFGFGAEEYEQYSMDTHWMPNTVLLAKSTLVWLDQLSKRYGRSIHRLDEIPEEELDRIAERGFTSLWLIGLWERSTASKTIKRSCGNPEAEASAYSLKRYEIAEEIGGWQALSTLRERCWQRGIRLASDMVPNHTGIDGDWVYDHPDWFLQLPYPPYPSYSYGSQNLSEDPDIGLYLEDHYYDRSDAALTFKRVDFRTGEERYIYHGNDGTSMPWNDTAQLDFLNPDTREAVIQTIIHVARNFSVIRFDAAMVLAKRHIHRLWYPAPGSGGDIPGRSEHGMSEAEFNRRMPIEFWREVVDRVAREAPDTLLLAEAFWMMEGYFVRTLGMHRVYNSAFMNMLKAEENEKYRNTIKNTLSFDPEILKRFVNFMNNPDEDTAIEQFGDGDKYFGVCTLMVTMPGLPMFGHGQVEGFREKYGMEYRRAYWDEQPNEALIHGHYEKIFPLMKRRYLFAEADHFLLYDLFRGDGSVDQNVFAYSNRAGGEAALVLYNNSYHSTGGTIHGSAPYAVREGEGRVSRDFTLGDGLNLTSARDHFTLLYEQRSGLWYIRESATLCRGGLQVQLHGYQSQVYLHIHEVYDSDGLYRRLWEELGGRGTKDIERAKKKLYLRPIHTAFRMLLQEQLTQPVRQALYHAAPLSEFAEEDLHSYYDDFLDACLSLGYGRSEGKRESLARFDEQLKALKELAPHCRPEQRPHRPDLEGYLNRGLSMMPEAPALLLGQLLITPLEPFIADDARYANAAVCAEDLMLPELLHRLYREARIPEERYPRYDTLLLALTEVTRWREQLQPGTAPDSLTSGSLERIIRAPYAARFLQINRHLEIEWFRGERLQELLWWISLRAVLENAASGQSMEKAERLFEESVARWLTAEELAEYRVELLLQHA
jgi:glycosidase